METIVGLMARFLVKVKLFIEVLSKRYRIRDWCMWIPHFVPLMIGPLFPNHVEVLKPKVGLGPNQIEIDLRKTFLENITLLFNKISYFWKIKTRKTLGHVYAYSRMCMHASCMHTNIRACVCMLGF